MLSINSVSLIFTIRGQMKGTLSNKSHRINHSVLRRFQWAYLSSHRFSTDVPQQDALRQSSRLDKRAPFAEYAVNSWKLVLLYIFTHECMIMVILNKEKKLDGHWGRANWNGNGEYSILGVSLCYVAKLCRRLMSCNGIEMGNWFGRSLGCYVLFSNKSTYALYLQYIKHGQDKEEEEETFWRI